VCARGVPRRTPRLEKSGYSRPLLILRISGCSLFQGAGSAEEGRPFASLEAHVLAPWPDSDTPASLTSRRGIYDAARIKTVEAKTSCMEPTPESQTARFESRWVKPPERAYIKSEVRNVATTPSNREFETAPPSRFITLSVRAGEVFANQEKALVWLQTPNPSLNGRTPLEATATEEGFQEADEVLTRIEFGVLG